MDNRFRSVWQFLRKLNILLPCDHPVCVRVITCVCVSMYVRVSLWVCVYVSERVCLCVYVVCV